jgi:glutathione peroxidase
MSIYNFKVKNHNGKEVNLSDYKDQVVLIVNTASECQYTKQLIGLQKLFEKYKDKGFTVIAFPSNEFGEQEPFSDDEIFNIYKEGYGVTFPVMAKLEVNGDNNSELYKYLQNEIDDPKNHKVHWNFVKFLIDRNGKPVARFESNIEPEEIDKEIKKLLDKK